LGSRASLRPSPNRLKERIIKLIINAGKIIRYGLDETDSRAADVKDPRLAIGADTPIPKKLRNASVKIADGICIMTVAII
jgi:hypothetical protein